MSVIQNLTFIHTLSSTYTTSEIEPKQAVVVICIHTVRIYIQSDRVT